MRCNSQEGVWMVKAKMPEIYEYAGFRYFLIFRENGQLIMDPVPGQHPAAYKEKHRRAAAEQYLDETTDINHRRSK
jgi:hypothetical protein